LSLGCHFGDCQGHRRRTWISARLVVFVVVVVLVVVLYGLVDGLVVVLVVVVDGLVAVSREASGQRGGKGRGRR
jgi:hypothetical protein